MSSKNSFENINKNIKPDNIEVNLANSLLCEKINKEYDEFETLSLLPKNKKEELEVFISKMSFLIYFSKFILFFSLFVITPNWCIIKGKNIDSQCREDIYGSTYYRSFIHFIPTIIISLVCNLMMMVILFYFYYINNILKNIKNEYTKTWNFKLNILIYLFTIHIIIYFLEKDRIIEEFRLTEIIKNIFLIVSSNYLYNLFYKIYLTLKKSIKIIFYFILGHFLIAYLAKVLFQGYDNYKDDSYLYSYNFESFINSYISIFLFFTLNNTPDIILKIEGYEYLIIPFYLIVVIYNFILLSYFISIIYLNKKLIMKETIEKCRSNQKKNIIMKYLMEKNYYKLSNNVIKKLIKLHSEKNILLDLERLKINRNALDLEIFNSERSASEEIYKVIIYSNFYKIFISFLNLFIAISSIIIIHYRLFYNVYFLSVCWFVFFDLLLFLVIVYFVKINKVNWNFTNVFNLFLNIFIIISTIVNSFFTHKSLRTDKMFLVKIWNLLCSFKWFVFFYFLLNPFNSRKLRVITRSLKDYIFDLFIMLLFIILLFSSFFLNKYGGNINSSIVDEYNSTIKNDIDYGIFNFNDTLNSMSTLTIVWINKNWVTITNFNSYVIKNKSNEMKIYFIIYVLLAYYLLISSIIAFMIDNIIMYLNNKKQIRNKIENSNNINNSKKEVEEGEEEEEEKEEGEEDGEEEEEEGEEEDDDKVQEDDSEDAEKYLSQNYSYFDSILLNSDLNNQQIEFLNKEKKIN